MSGIKNKKVLFILGGILLLVVILLFLTIAKHKTVTTLLYCTDHGIKTSQGQFYFVPNLGREPFLILIRDQNGQASDSLSSHQLCDSGKESAEFRSRIIAVESNWLGFLTGVYIGKEN
ncbi:MAG: hypothetical protein A3F54_04160 [Candidatus Kerfeldbacteria bacterium RIFCSPHIGHO2_12_FULL_48_17]|uniref:Uncharacterized protein n=1 Tax=Candidatus Kerfeldbacteria bacterium RIFCSPHIGHO2_12_FULL_48_17 TaxID=1798542 RepID=A0A1G2B6W5_9BACT|nr:MAG: hypothetical protein A3F54_04160 [Candidatus Kerfeldbacteria bacterium RIFCSPHIGHO2_12_FULL_48_17]